MTYTHCKSGPRFPESGLRSFISILALSTLALHPVRAQQNVPPPVSDTVFPLGGLTFGLTSDATLWNQNLGAFGLNTVNYGAGSTLPGLIPGLTAYPSASGNGNNDFTSYAGNFLEYDFDVASNEDGMAAWDLGPYSNGQFLTSWGSLPSDLSPSTDGGERFIGGSDLILKTPQDKIDTANYYLSAFSQHYDQTNHTWVNNSTYQVNNQYVEFNFGTTSTFYLDFIFRVDPTISQYQSLADNAEIYELDISINGQTPIPVPIHKGPDGSYNDYDYGSKTGSDWYTQTTWPWVGATKFDPELIFPNQKLNPDKSGQNYRIQRVALPNGTINSISIDLKKTDNSFGIYVRGVRMRSDMADNFFRGQYDNSGPPLTYGDGSPVASLTQTFQNIYSFIGTGWKYTKVYSCLNEALGPLNERAYAYINEEWRAWSKAHGGQKDIYSIMASGGYAPFRAIYEDQSNGIPPPVLQAEEPLNQFWSWKAWHCLGREDHDFNKDDFNSGSLLCGCGDGRDCSGQPAFGHLFPGDAIPSEVKNSSGFKEFGLTISGWNGTNYYGGTPESDPHSGTVDSHTGTYDIDTDNYNTYTWRYRNSWHGSYYQSEYFGAATSCYPQNKSGSWTTFYGYPSTLSSHIFQQGGDPITSTISQAIYQQMRNCASPITLPFSDVDGSGNYDNLFRIGLGMATEWEIRQQTWNALAWGAKGIMFNPIGADGGGDDGFCNGNFRHDVNSGISGVADGDQNYIYYPNFWYHDASQDSYVSYQKTSGDGGYPDHLVHNTSSILAWDQSTAYTPGQSVKDKGCLYTCKNSNQNDEPPSANWNATNEYISAMWVPCLTDRDLTDPVSGQTLTQGSPLNTDLIDPNHIDWVDLWLKATGKSTLAGWEGQQPWWIGTQCDATSLSTWIAFDASLDGQPPCNSAWWNQLYYPAYNAQIGVTAVPTYYGVKDRADGVIQSTKDIIPIAAELKVLRWHSAFSYADLAVTATTGNIYTDENAWAKQEEKQFPLTLVSSQKVARYSFSATSALRFTAVDTVDAANQEYYTMSTFCDPNDPDAVYVIIANERTWPIIYSGDHSTIESSDPTDHTSNPAKYLGAKDARILNLKLKSSWSDSSGNSVNWGNQGINYYTITNLRTGLDFVDNVSNPQTYSISFDPGEGTLLRIAPATSVELGRTPYAGMAYNNGHRICKIGTGPDYGVVWEDNGKIMFCRVQNERLDPIGSFGQTSPTNYSPQVVYPAPGTTLPSDHSADAHNPSIAASSTNPNEVAIVYSIDDFANYPAKGTRQVIFTKSSSYTDWNSPGNIIPIATGLPYSTPFVKDITGNIGANSENLLTPVITPAANGGYYVAYASGGIDACVITSSGGIEGRWVFFDPSSQLRMCSVASANQQVTGDPTDPIPAHIYERFYVAWEKDHPDGSSAIVFTYVDHDLSLLTPPTYHGFSSRTVSDDDACSHYRHPMIAVGDPDPVKTEPQWGRPGVVWEDWSASASHLRELTSWNTPNLPNWSGFTIFRPFASEGKLNISVPLPLLRYEDIVGCSYCNLWSPSPSATLFKEVTYQDTFHHEQFLSKFANPGPAWNVAGQTKLKEYAQLGNVSLPYLEDPYPDPGILSYRGTVADENGQYATKVVTGPPADMSVKTELIKSFTAERAPNVACASWRLTLGGTSITLPPPIPPTPPTQIQVPWQTGQLGTFIETPLNDTENVISQAQWPLTEDSVRTAYFPTNVGDTLVMNRALEVDTTELPTLLSSPADFLSYKLVIKDSATSQITQVIDSALVVGENPAGGTFEPGTNPSDTTMNGEGYRIIAPIMPTPSGVGYVTVLITKDSATQAQLVQDEIYADTLLLPQPGDSSSDSGAFKRSQPHPQALGTPQQELTVTVHPNPVRGTVKICVDDLPAQIPVSVDVVNELGTQVAMLYNATPEAELGLCLSLDCTNLPAGIYYADLQTQGQHKAVQFTVEH